MILLKKEIDDNKNALAAIKEDFVQTKQAYGILLSSGWKTMAEDSLRKHVFNATKISSYGLSRAAWNVFQQSDVIKNLDDKEMVVLLSGLYTSIDIMENWWETFSREKSAMVDVRTNSDNFHEFVDALLSDKRALQFMENIYKYNKYTFEQPFENVIDLADYAFFLINKNSDYQYEFKNIEREFQTFLEKKSKNIEK